MRKFSIEPKRGFFSYRNFKNLPMQYVYIVDYQ